MSNWISAVFATMTRDGAALRVAAFNILAVIFLGLTAYIVLADRTWPAAGRGTITFFAAALCCLIGNLDRLESLKVSMSGIESRTRAIVAQAEDALAEVHELAATTGRVLIELIASNGRFGGGSTHAEKQTQKAAIISTLRKIGLSDDKIVELEASDYRWNVIDYVYAITSSIQARLQPHQIAEWNNFTRETHKDLERPSPDQLEDFIRHLGLLDGETRERIEDLRHYRRWKSHRRPDVWMRGYD